MNRTPIVSSNIKSVGYDSELQILEVEFMKNGINQFEAVSSLTYNDLVDAASSGSYFDKNIKGKYKYGKI